MQTLIFSDFHMSPAAREDGVWMRYRNRRFFIDGEYGELVDEILARLGDEPFEVVFNGDMFELDGADAFHGRGGRSDREVGCEQGERAGLARILDDHDGFVQATARLLVRCQRLVFLAGNHDLSLYWPAVQNLLRRRLVAAAEALPEAPARVVLDARLRFEQWFYRPHEGLFVEHGQFYDPASRPPDPLVPRRGDGGGLWMTLGSAGFRHIMGGIGTMNPHAHETFILGGWGYLKHWWRYYVRGGRSLVRTWLAGSYRVARHLFGQGAAAQPDADTCRNERVALSLRSGLSAERIEALRELHPPAATDTPYAILRELWLDRVLLLLPILLLVTLSGVFLPWLVTLLLGLAGVAVLGLYESYAPASDIDGYREGLPRIASEVSRITGARVVVHAHTHTALREELEDGVVFIDTGTWSPEFLDPECTIHKNTPHTFAWIRFDKDELSRADVFAWRDGHMLPLAAVEDAEAVRAVPDDSLTDSITQKA